MRIQSDSRWSSGLSSSLQDPRLPSVAVPNDPVTAEPTKVACACIFAHGSDKPI
jgi:hypothetical protein